MVPGRLHGDNRVMMHVTLTTPTSRFVKSTDAADQGPLDPILGMRA
jgi:hypothetical protein